MNRILVVCIMVWTIWQAGLASSEERGWAASIAWSPDGQMIAVSSTSGVWFFDTDFNDSGQVFTPEFEGQPATTLDWSASGEYLAAGYTRFDAPILSGGFPIVIIDARDQEVISMLRLDDPLTSTVRWHPEDNFIMAGTLDGTIHIWDAATGEERFSFQATFDLAPIHIQSVCWLTESTVAILGTRESYIVDVQQNSVLETIERTYFVQLGDCSIQGNMIMIGVLDKVYDLSDNMAIANMSVQTYSSADGYVFATDVAWSPDGSRILINGEGCRVYVFEGQNRDLLADLEGSFSDVLGLPIYVDSIAWHPDNSQFAIVGQFDIRLWDGETYELLRRYDGFEIGYHVGPSTAVSLNERERIKKMEADGVMCPAQSAP